MAAKFPGVRRLLPLLLAVLALGVPSATAQTGPGTCTPRLLVLSAFPAELDALLPAAHIKTMVQRSDRAFYVGKLEGNNVVMALTGIGRAAMISSRSASEIVDADNAISPMSARRPFGSGASNRRICTNLARSISALHTDGCNCTKATSMSNSSPSRTNRLAGLMSRWAIPASQSWRTSARP